MFENTQPAKIVIPSPGRHHRQNDWIAVVVSNGCFRSETAGELLNEGDSP